MQLTKLAHACVRLDADGEILVIDPGAFGGADALDGANAVLVTHEHFDHVEPDTLRAAMTANPGLRLWAPAPVADQFADFGDRVSAVRHGDDFTAAGFSVHVYGEHHAIIHPDIPTIVNVGFLVDGEVFHPGDSYTVPEDPVNTLLVPISGPWYSTREMIDYVRAVAPRRTFAIHDALLSPIGLNVTEMFAGLAAGPNNASYTWVEPGSTVDL
jgi:L-ascorbate metabolism protein UlaG (beta-lactamase superfamily)